MRDLRDGYEIKMNYAERWIICVLRDSSERTKRSDVVIFAYEAIMIGRCMPLCNGNNGINYVLINPDP